MAAFTAFLTMCGGVQYTDKANKTWKIYFPNPKEAEVRLAEFEGKWGSGLPAYRAVLATQLGTHHPVLRLSTRDTAHHFTTNAIESVNMSLRKITKNRGSFPSDEALLKLFYLALMNISQKWTMPLQNWKGALNRFSIMFEDRMPIR